jgi:hypothetical protein
MNTYKLLRNNKEIGPLSLEELIAKGLQPYDLIWVQNKSAAWRYPSEIEELKSYSLTNTTNQASTPNKQKPRFRITATSKKIEEKSPVAPAPLPKVQPEHSAYIPNETRVSSSLATLNHYNNSTPQEPALETKYQGSLDDIKKRYEETVLKPKQRGFVYRYAWLIIIPILAAGIWLGYKLSAKPETKDIAAVTKTKLESITIPADSFIIPERSSGIDPADINKPAKSTAGIIDTQNNVIAAEREKLQTQTKQTPADDPNKQIVPARDEIILPAPKTTAVVVPETKERQPRVRSEQDLPVLEDKPVSTPSPAKPAASKSKKVNDYVVVDGDYKKLNNSIQDLSLKVENVTPYPIDLVVLDIQYFDKNGKLQKGETVYAKNIAPRRDVVVNASFSNNAYSVGYKVSLVSAEKAGVYLVAE